MSQTINVNGESINYPETGDTNWGDEATQFAIQTSAALGKIGLASGTSVDIAQTLDVTGATTLDSTLTVAGTANLNGNNNLGNASSDTTAITGILNVDSGVLYVDPTNNRVGINDTTPSEALDVTGNALISGTLGVTGVIIGLSATLTDLTVDTNLIKTISASNFVGINTTTPTKALDVTGEILVSSNITIGGVLIADDSTNVTTAPPITFTGDLNTGIGHSAEDTLDFVTGGVSRAKISSIGQQSSVVPDLSGSNTTLFPEYKCRAWVNFNGTLSGTITPRANGNVSSVTKNGTGDYTVNFTTAMPDANYAISYMMADASNGSQADIRGSAFILSGSFRFYTRNGTGSTLVDNDLIMMSVFR
jgi:hypothetical protein